MENDSSATDAGVEEKKDGAREQKAADAAVSEGDLPTEDLKDDLRSIRGYGEDR